MISIRELYIAYGSTTAVDGIDVDVSDRELLAMVGSSGSGKSSVLHAIAGLVTPVSGSIEIAGVDVVAMSDAERSAWRLANVGLIFQFGELVPELSLADNVALPLMLQGRRRRNVRPECLALLDRLGVGDVADHRPGQVSGGQMQRAAIARALIHRPSVVLADEPTGALDTSAGLLAMEALTDLAREQGTCVIVVTHDARIASLCDRDVTLRDGRLVEPSISRSIVGIHQ